MRPAPSNGIMTRMSVSDPPLWFTEEVSIVRSAPETLAETAELPKFSVPPGPLKSASVSMKVFPVRITRPPPTIWKLGAAPPKSSNW